MEDITVKELKEKIDRSEEFVLIDVREPHEHEEFSIGGSLIPLGNLPLQLDELEDQKEQEVIVYCRSGARSGMAKQLLLQAGFKKVRNVLGGMLDWKETFPNG